MKLDKEDLHRRTGPVSFRGGGGGGGELRSLARIFSQLLARISRCFLARI